VLDDRTLAIPDRLRNRRADTFKNLLRCDSVGLFFLVPGKRETLRVSGRAIIVRDRALRETMKVSGKLPDFALVKAGKLDASVEKLNAIIEKDYIPGLYWRGMDLPMRLSGAPDQA